MTSKDIKPEVDDASAALTPSHAAHAMTQPTRARYKSYRKKYRKMHLEFSRKMEDAHNLFATEYKAAETARRIQEENDKILDILLSINQSAVVPSKHRYNLASPTQYPASSLPRVDDDYPYSLPAPANSLEHLSKMATHTVPRPGDQGLLSDEMRDALNLPGYDGGELKDDLASCGQMLRSFPSIEQEEAALATIDRALAHLSRDSIVPPESELKLTLANEEKTEIKPAHSKRHKDINLQHEFALHSSISVQNWLNKHSQQLTNASKDKGDAGSDKAKSPPPNKKKARQSKKEDKLETDPLDEELGVDPEPPAKGKRKRLADGEDAYRPKGGSGAKKRKRASETGEDVKRKAKKLHGANGNDED